MDPYSDDISDEDVCDSTDEDLKRDLEGVSSTYLSGIWDRSVEKRGEKRGFEIDWTILAIAWSIRVASRRYPGSTHLHDATRSTPASDVAFRYVLSSQLLATLSNLNIEWNLDVPRLTSKQF